jgi:hypothetical protein
LSTSTASASIASRGPVHEDHRHAGLEVTQEVGVVALDGRDHEPVHPAVAKPVDELALALRILVGAADEREHAPGASHLLDPAVNRGEEGIGDVLDDQPDAGRGAIGTPQRAGGEVAPVSEERHGLADALGEIGAHRSVAVHHARHGARADPREGGHVVHRRAPARARRPVWRRPGHARKRSSTASSTLRAASV